MTWALTHPPSTLEENDQWWRTLNHVADGYKEKHISRSALKILPTFHMDYKQVLAVGKNMIESLEGIDFGQEHVSVKLPEWWKDRR